MEALTELTDIRTPKRTASGEKKLQRRLVKLTNVALDCLEDILTDEGVKAADRISAAKLAFELARQQAQEPEPVSDGVIKVIFDGCPKEYAE